MAWCARLTRDTPEIIVKCGNSVEFFADGFSEGAWSGAFDSHAFATATSCCATGMVVRKGCAEFICPSHTIQALFSQTLNDSVWVSNSLPFLLASSGSSLRDGYPYYESDLMTIMFGLKAYKHRLPLSEGRSAEVHYHCHLRYSRSLSLVIEQKNDAPAFSSFDAYIAFLQSEVDLTVKNACDQRRRIHYSPLATVSTGYDSPMCGALARQAGCKEGITLLKPFVVASHPQASDSGKEIGSTLGLTMTEISIDGPGKTNWQTEVEFVGTGYGADDLVFSAAEPLLRNRLLFVGMHGDKIWDTHLIDYGQHLVRGDPSGGSMSEFRLRAGFVVLPVPFLGATHYREITAISLSEEMKPWRVADHSYDRPIPRRFVESFGIQRSSFGQNKKVIASPLHPTGGNFPHPESLLSSDSCQKFQSFLNSRGHHRTRQLTHDAMYFIAQNLIIRLMWNTHFSRLLARLGLRSFCRHVTWRYAKRWSENYWLFHWAFSELGKRYSSGP